MKLARHWLIAATTILLPGTAIAEVSVHPHGDGRISTVVMGEVDITDGIDPIPQKIWDKIRDVPLDWILNPDGMLRGDGRPDVAFHPETGWPVVVWAWRQDVNHDIAISHWDGTKWTTAEFLTDGPADELDPRVFVRKNGQIYIAWWVDGGDPHVMLAQRNPTPVNDPWNALRVSPIGEPARRPSVAVLGNVVRVAYERDAAAEAFHPAEVVVRRLESTGGAALEYVGYGEWTEPMDPVLHVGQGNGPDNLWLDWKLGVDLFGYSKLLDDLWADVNTEVWTDPSWVGEESVRRAIAVQVATGQAPATPGEPPDDGN